MNTIPTAGVVLFKGDEVLLVEHKEGASNLTGVYGIPAGRIDMNESARQTAVRELKEETGLIVQENDLIELPTMYTASLERKDGSKKEFSLKVFFAKSSGGSFIENNETVPTWVKRDTINTYKLLPNVESAVKEAEGLK